MQSNQNPNAVQDIEKKFNRFFTVYKALGELLNDLPIHPSLIDKVRFDIDSAFLWIKEGMQMAIQNAQAQTSQTQSEVKIPDVEDAPKSQEEVTH